MRKTILAASLSTAALALPGLAFAQAAPAAAAPASPHTFTGNVNLVTDYRFRGISQTYGEPAIQGGFDYSHSSGFYLGTWASNVTGSLLNGPSYTNGNMEWDFYGGYKWEVAKDLTLDVGGLYYWYPNANYLTTTKDKYNNFELYLAGSYKWFSAKYSITTTDYFGTRTNTFGAPAWGPKGYCGFTSGFVPGTTCAGSAPGDSKGSGYLDLTGTWEVADKLNLIAHYGHQSVHHYSHLSYSDYKVGLTKEWGGFNWGASIIGTDANKDWWRAIKGTGTGLQSKDPGKATVVLSLGKTF
jgi:uncharacterized protein (TIGR02001 family)